MAEEFSQNGVTTVPSKKALTDDGIEPPTSGLKVRRNKPTMLIGLACFECSPQETIKLFLLPTLSASVVFIFYRTSTVVSFCGARSRERHRARH